MNIVFRQVYKRPKIANNLNLLNDRITGRKCDYLAALIQVPSKHSHSFHTSDRHFRRMNTDATIKRHDETTASSKNELASEISGNLEQRYLHIAPCGDYWVGTTIFAAKHLQPDYVKSIPIPEDFDPEYYFENVVDDNRIATEILNQAYDDGSLPPHVLDTYKNK